MEMNRSLFNSVDLLARFLDRSNIAAFIITLLVIGIVAQGLWAQKPGYSPCRIVDLSFDDKDDVHASAKYTAAIQKLLEREKFDELECIADSDRSTKATFSGGQWKLWAVYAGTEAPRGHATEE